MTGLRENSSRIVCLVLGLLLLGISTPASAGKFNRKLSAGDPAPQWADLTGTDDKKHSLSDYKETPVLVIVFICNTCHVAKMYEKRLVEFSKTYRKKGVTLIAISSSRVRADRLEKMKARAAASGFNFDYVIDPTQKIGRAYGAILTPQAFVLDKNRRIAYLGAFDDSMHPKKAERHYVNAAVDALLANKQPEITETRQFGCAIEYQKK